MEMGIMKAFILSRYIAFVPCPGLRGLWKRVEACVVLVDCPVCGSKKGVPCKSRDGRKYWSSNHADRDRAAKGMKIKIHTIEVDLPEE
jgi:hypothetical protein